MDSLETAIGLLKIKEVQIIGSFKDLALKYFSDVDMQEVLTTNLSYEDIADQFAVKIKNIQKNPDVYLIDIKAGFYGGKPLKWRPKEVIEGYKYFDGVTIRFVEVLTQKSIIKIDVIIMMNNTLIEVSTNYYIDFGKAGKTFEKPTVASVSQRLLYNYQELKSKDFYKAMKRLYSYYKLSYKTTESVGHKKEIGGYLTSLQRVFNSKLGLLNKNLSDLTTVHSLILSQLNRENKTIKKSQLINSIDQIMNNIDMYKKYRLLTPISRLGQMNLMGLSKTLESEIEGLKFKLDIDVKNFLDKSSIRKDIGLK